DVRFHSVNRTPFLIFIAPILNGFGDFQHIIDRIVLRIVVDAVHRLAEQRDFGPHVAAMRAAERQRRRLADEREIGNRSMRDRVPGPAAAASIERTLIAIDLGFFDFTSNAGDDHVAFKLDTCALYAFGDMNKGGKRRLHVVDAETVYPIPIDDGLWT